MVRHTAYDSNLTGNSALRLKSFVDDFIIIKGIAVIDTCYYASTTPFMPNTSL